MHALHRYSVPLSVRDKDKFDLLDSSEELQMINTLIFLFGYFGYKFGLLLEKFHFSQKNFRPVKTELLYR